MLRSAGDLDIDRKLGRFFGNAVLFESFTCDRWSNSVTCAVIKLVQVIT